MESGPRRVCKDPIVMFSYKIAGYVFETAVFRDADLEKSSYFWTAANHDA